MLELACLLPAGSRACDVYMGVDVFGRGSFEGGQLRSGLAVEAAFSAGAVQLLRAWHPTLLSTSKMRLTSSFNMTWTQCQDK